MRLVTLRMNMRLVTLRMNMSEHALERHAAAVRQLSNGTNDDDLYINIATVGNVIQTVNSPMYDTYLSKLLLVTQRSQEPYTATYRQHKVARPWLGANLQCISQHPNPLCQPNQRIILSTCNFDLQLGVKNLSIHLLCCLKV